LNKEVHVRKIYRSRSGNVYLAVGRIIPKEWKIVKMTVQGTEDDRLLLELEKLA
jgi:hypothetical protein